MHLLPCTVPVAFHLGGPAWEELEWNFSSCGYTRRAAMLCLSLEIKASPGIGTVVWDVLHSLQRSCGISLDWEELDRSFRSWRDTRPAAAVLCLHHWSSKLFSSVLALLFEMYRLPALCHLGEPDREELERSCCDKTCCCSCCCCAVSPPLEFNDWNECSSS